MIFVILASILLADLWVHEFWPTLTYLTTSAARSTAFSCISDLDKAVVILVSALPNKSAIRIHLISVALGTCLTRICKVRVLGFAADFDSHLGHIDPRRKEGICRCTSRFSLIRIASYSVSDSGMGATLVPMVFSRAPAGLDIVRCLQD